MKRLVAAVLLAFAASAHAQDFSFGSKPGETLEASAIFFDAGLKNRSHFGFGEHGSREGEVAFRRDAGFPATLPVLGGHVVVNAGELGWLGGELLGFSERHDVKQLARLRQMDGVPLSEGDVIETSARVLWGGLHYGYEVRVRFFEALDIAVSPTFGFGVFDIDASLQRLAPDISTVLGGHATAFVLAPGGLVSVEAFDVFRVGADLEFGLTGLKFAVSTPHVDLWERIRFFFGVTFYGVDLTVGWREAATHIEGDGRAVDLRLRGLDVTLGARF